MPLFQGQEAAQKASGVVGRGPSFCPAASLTAIAVSVSALRPRSQLKLWVVGDKIQNQGWGGREEEGQAGLCPQTPESCV